MNDSLFFATFDPLFVNAPEACSMCVLQPPIFSYEYSTDEEEGTRTYHKGFCCAACATALVNSLADREAEEWESEEAAMESEHLDVTDFQKRRLATFGVAAPRS
ncbi:MAG TPA: hypothetical protein VFA89_06575 [Terriglobales bacterium]|nr:hypothetical protein [Terriglobales bacterium]